MAASFEPGVTASEVARSAGIYTSQLFRWRKDLCQRSDASVPQLLPVEIATAPMPASPSAPEFPAPAQRRKKTGIIEIELGGGRRVRVDRDVDAAALRRVLDALSQR